MVKTVPDIQDIFNKLDFVGRSVLFKYINDESHKIMLDIAKDIDDCILAMLIENFPDKSYEEIEKLANVTSIYREDQEVKLKKIRGKSDKEIDKMSKDVADRSVELVLEGKNQNAAIKILGREFPQMPKATLVKAYKLSKENVKKEVEEVAVDETVITAETDAEINKLVEYIVSDSKPKAKSKFKINNITIGGEYDVYNVNVIDKTVNGVLVAEYTEKTNDEIMKLNKEIEILIKHRDNLKDQLGELKEVEKEFLL